MGDFPNDPHTIGMASMAEAMRLQTEAFVRAMDAQTTEIKRLSDKVDTMQSRVIRLEEQRHGKDIEKLTNAVALANDKIAILELNWAQARGAGALMTWMKNFLPWIGAVLLAFLLFMGVELNPVKGVKP